MKVCSRCGDNKDEALFSKAKTCVDGHRTYCKVCEKIRKDSWRLANKEKHNAKCKAWARANPDKRRAIVKADREKRTVSGAQAAAKRDWTARNIHKARAMVSARRRKLRQATPKWADRKRIRQLYEQANKLGLTVDHIVPIIHELVCGLHVSENLQLLTAKANYAKSNLFAGHRTKQRVK